MPREVPLLKPTTCFLASLCGLLGAGSAAHLGWQWYRTRKIAPELRHPRLLVHPLWRAPSVWQRSFPFYAAEHIEPRTSRGDVTGIRVSSRNIPGYQGGPDVAVREYRAGHRTANFSVLWLHNGGFVGGTPEAEDGVCALIARTLGCTVISVEYRLAGTAPFPAPLHDARAAYAWMCDTFDAGRIVVGGAGAGGGLAACLTQWLTDAGTPPAFQLLIEPMLDDRTRVTRNPGRGEFVWGHTANTLAWNCYLSYLTPHDDAPEYAAANRRLDLGGLPPTFVAVGDLDLLYEEALTYARRLKEHGVEVSSMILPGAYHGALTERLDAPLVQDAWAKAFEAIRKHVRG
ncbi:alpha/beta hydrolase fold domain-containing protein [Corynebacterium sp.]|uniref:alpha/beta hydrolase fold domain-containing protein n=1 Tax=Corynebacterium sp. TaxID=1720 RepID=UPI0026DB1DF2|nr:alpha/beta hydrolase fold domain-containing protein [Corynebacterium sp.]MDO5076522.1 alpha/beta hydrolase fold domain-containing protein [Corynebacterium sp.]